MRKVHLNWAVKQSSSPQSAEQSAAGSQVLHWHLASGHWHLLGQGALVLVAANVPAVGMLSAFYFPVLH